MVNPYTVVDLFEKTIAKYAGSKYGVAVESCCAALFLCCKYLKVKTVYLPKFTYPGVACSVIHAGGKCKFDNRYWYGQYSLKPYPIWDAALRFSRGMYVKGSYYCLSFHVKKHIPIGRGGMILCDSKKAYEWFKRARFDGRNEVSLSEQKDITVCGYNMYLTPEQAVRGLQLFDSIKDKTINNLNCYEQGYPDLSKIKAYKS